MDLGEVLASSTRSIDERDGRVYGFLAGSVTTVDAKLNRVRARFGAMADGEESNWLDPIGIGSVESVPRVGDPVYVSFVDGDMNRGIYACYQKSTTKNRATEAMLLGSTFVGMYNDLVAKFNNLKSNYNSFITTYNAHKHTVAGITSGNQSVTSAITGQTTSDGDDNAATAMDANGATVAAIASSKVVLSGLSKVR